jgi:hypothetical protein
LTPIFSLFRVPPGQSDRDRGPKVGAQPSLSINNANQSIVAVDNSAGKATYTGPAITSKPSGIAAAHPSFGRLGAIFCRSLATPLINGTINGFDPITALPRKFVGAIKDEKGKPFILNNLGGIACRDGDQINGAIRELLVTVGQGIGPAELAGTFLIIVYKP